MALCSSLQAKGTSVVTESGQEVGSFLGVIVDTERGSIVQLEVRPAGLVRGLVAHELVIQWSDVMDWTEKQIIVKDAAVPAKMSATAPSAVPSV